MTQHEYLVLLFKKLVRDIPIHTITNGIWLETTALPILLEAGKLGLHIWLFFFAHMAVMFGMCRVFFLSAPYSQASGSHTDEDLYGSEVSFSLWIFSSLIKTPLALGLLYGWLVTWQLLYNWSVKSAVPWLNDTESALPTRVPRSNTKCLEAGMEKLLPELLESQS